MRDLFRHWSAIARATTIGNTAIVTDHNVVCNSCEILSETFRSLSTFLPPLSFTFSLIGTPEIIETSKRVSLNKEYDVIITLISGKESWTHRVNLLLLNIHLWLCCRCIISYCIETIRGKGRACFQLKLTIGVPGHALFLYHKKILKNFQSVAKNVMVVKI